jgi:hypothetical protein
LNPGFIAPTPFYNTTRPEQAKYYYGTHAYQPGPTFDPNLYNYAPAAPNTPFGSQYVAPMMTSQQIMDLIMGKQLQQPNITPATKVIPTPPGSKPIEQLGIYAPQLNQIPATPVNQVTPTTPGQSGVTNEQFKEVSKALGSDWLIRQQKAAETGDWATYYQIQAQVYAILNPNINAG